MTGLTVGFETDALIIAAFRIGFVTIVAIELSAINGRNIRGEMTLVIEPKHVGVARFVAYELKFRVPIPKGIERLGVAPTWSRQFKDDLLRRMKMPMVICPLKLHPFLRRSLHARAVAVTRGALRARDQA